MSPQNYHILVASKPCSLVKERLFRSALSSRSQLCGSRDVTRGKSTDHHVSDGRHVNLALTYSRACGHYHWPPGLHGAVRDGKRCYPRRICTRKLTVAVSGWRQKLGVSCGAGGCAGLGQGYAGKSRMYLSSAGHVAGEGGRPAGAICIGPWQIKSVCGGSRRLRFRVSGGIPCFHDCSR